MHAAPKGRNLAGIIPLSGKEKTFGMPWSDYLQPISEDYTALEKSVYECALAGCDSIWIVCNDDSAPLAKYRTGDYILDPQIFNHWSFLKNKEDHKEYIPIFYVPINQKDRDRRDSFGWSILHGSLTAFTVSSRISSWSKPTKYFVSFPWGLYDYKIIKNHRGLIRGKESVFFSHAGKTARDNKYLPFTFFPEDWLIYKRALKENCTGGDPNLPLKERWSSKDFTLDKIFNHGIIEMDQKIEVGQYYTMEDWSSLLSYYKSDLNLERPSKIVLKPYRRKK